MLRNRSKEVELTKNKWPGINPLQPNTSGTIHSAHLHNNTDMHVFMDTKKQMPFTRLVWQVAALNCGFPFVFRVRFRPVHTVAHQDKNKYTKRLLCTQTRCIAAIVIGRFTQWLLYILPSCLL